VFLHGGGYTTFSARSSLFASVPLSAELRRTIIALDYPLAPDSRYDCTVPATERALASVLDEYPDAFLAGDSAGGGLALAACNRLLGDSQRQFSGLVLISPWTDLGDRGDSRLTQREHDPLLHYDPTLAACALAYAPGADTDPEASPVFAHYDSRFPPTLIVSGTRDILLSDSIRLYRRLHEAGVRVALDLHDGLYHSFPIVTPETPEAHRARVTINAFIKNVCGEPK
jgi:acetyl esterase/lipase